MGRSASILPAVDHTAPAILELGLLLLLAALAGKAARSMGLPAVIGYLLVGGLVSPFTPGNVANRDQLSILADVGGVLLLFEVGIEINSLRLAREGRRLLLLAPLQVAVTWILSAAACVALGMSIAGAAMIGLDRHVVERGRRQHHAQPAPHDRPPHRRRAAGVERDPGPRRSQC